ncbi:MAG: hydroxymethylpyrimidine/phosphomethylpyrimidine kinase [Bacteroidota bacterium]
MAEERTYVLSIAGFDPSGGAGILADIKTFEANKVCGMGAISALTFQNDTEFDSLTWIETEEILKQVLVLKRKFDFRVIKIGLIKDLVTLENVISNCQYPTSKVQFVWDPIIKASAGFEFHKNFEKEKLFSVLNNCFLITPNTDEIKFLTGIDNPMDAAEELSKYCNVLLKGGHNKEEPGVDYLFMKNKIEKIVPTEQNIFPKHGSGCVLSSAIAANLALGNDLITSCKNAKKYVEQFLSSSPSLLGIHHV